MSNEPLEPKETVILVHGTFAAPRKDRLQWYQPQSGNEASFISRLDDRLSVHQSKAKCWGHNNAKPDFEWSGENSWVARESAAQNLSILLARLQREGWRTHIVAHSHGGNVALNAICKLGSYRGWSNGTVVTLGTPYLYEPPEDNDRGILATLEAFVSVGVALVILLSMWVWIEKIGFIAPYNLPTFDLRDIFLLSLVGAGIVSAIQLIRIALSNLLRGFNWGGEWGRFTAISSNYDEAYQLLAKVVALENPFRSRSHFRGPIRPGKWRWWKILARLAARKVAKTFRGWATVLRETDRVDQSISRHRSWFVRVLLYGGGGYLFCILANLVQPPVDPSLIPYGASILFAVLLLRPLSLATELFTPLHFVRMMLAHFRALASSTLVWSIKRWGWGVT